MCCDRHFWWILNQSFHQKLRAEANAKKADYEKMIDEVEALLETCPAEERPALERRLADLQAGYQALCSSMEERENLCDKFADYYDTRTAAERKLEDLQRK